MTALQIFSAVLTELNKSKAPTLLLEDFNYIINKEIIKYINKTYNLDEINQQKTDDLRVLESTAVLIPTLTSIHSTSNLLKDIYEVYLPDDYLHIRNCVIEYIVVKDYQCYKTDEYLQVGARRLSGDKWSQILNNYYFRPSIKTPYFYISNVGISNNYPTTDNISNIPNLPVNKQAGIRYGNNSKVRMEIRFGKNSNFQIYKVYVDYIKNPKYIQLTQDQIDNVADTSDVIEFPDYVIYEIINGIVDNILENTSNPRLQTHIPINTTIPQK